LPALLPDSPKRTKDTTAMKALSKQTRSIKPAEVEKNWHIIDADGLVVGRLAAIVANQTKSAERFGRMVSFFDGVGTPDRAGYGFRGVPEEPKGFRERNKKLRLAKAKAEEAVGT
jgi:hypothetical protein